MNIHITLSSFCVLGRVLLLSVCLPGLTLVGAEELPPLTTVSGNPRLPGKFVWVDLVTDDVPAARTFYARLFGWTFRNVGDYTIAANDERLLCGMFQRPRPADRPEAKPRWFGYISVPNVPRAQRAVIKGGGKVLAEPMKYPRRGEQAVFADPDGAMFGVVKSSSGDPEDFLPEPGDWIWIQLFSRDARKACEFYSAVAGYEVVENTSSKWPDDFVLTSDGYARAAVMTLPDRHGDVQPNWLPFVRVTSARDSAAKAKGLGGRVLIEPKADLFEGRLAVITDPTGAAIGILEWSQDEAKGTR